MRLCFLEPYFTGSHARWINEFTQHSMHDVRVLKLDGQFWQWRLLGAAVTLADQYRQLDEKPDLLIASDMLDLSTFVALARPACKTLLYFHENQLLYPRGPRQKLQNHYAFINYISALTADHVCFNSDFHRDAFLEELPRLLKHFPDHNNLHTVEAIRHNSSTLPIGVHLARFENHYVVDNSPRKHPLILWNHRWDFDKNPRLFAATITALFHEGHDFDVAITGENSMKDTSLFDDLAELLSKRMVAYGYLDDFAQYAALLWQADVIVSTAIQEFFGMSTVEAIYCGCYPLLPKRLNYPYLIPKTQHQAHLYTTDEGLLHRLRDYLTQRPAAPPALRAFVARYDWSVLAAHYDDVFHQIATT